MGISETIVAAIIGALATMATAIVQLVRNRSTGESKPKKNRMRSLVATIALMVGCIVGGYAWSALRTVSAKDDLRATMEAEFTKQFAALAATQREAAATPTSPMPGGAIQAREGESGVAESLAHLPPCKLVTSPDEVGPVTCSAQAAPAIALCASIPAAARAQNIRVLARVPKSESPWLERDAGAPTLGSLHFGTAVTEYAMSVDQRSVCLDVSNWSVEDTLAVRVIVEYAFGPKSGELTANSQALTRHTGERR